MKNTHISSNLTQKKMTADVFVLDEPERRILKYLALHGPMNIHQIEKYTTNYGYGLERWGIKNRLYGSPRFIGLIPYDFVFETFEDKHRFGKQEKKCHLTLKGILASCATVPIEKNYFVKEFVKEMTHMSDNAKLKEIVLQYMAEHVKLLITWYYANGFQMQKNTAGGYFTQQDLEDFYHTESLRFSTPDKTVEKELTLILRNCLKLNTVLDLVGGDGLESELSLAHSVKFVKEKSFRRIPFFSGILLEWPLYLGNKNRYPKNKLSSFNTKSEIRYDKLCSEDFVKDVQNEIQNLGFSESLVEFID